MNLLLKRILGASFAFAAFSFVNPTPANAQSCAVAPTCESLGYSQTAEDCNGRYALKCPFDTSRVFCGDNTNIYDCDRVSQGDILLYDSFSNSLACVRRSEFFEISSKYIPIAVIYQPYDRVAIALDNSQPLVRSDEAFDIPDLKNFKDLEEAYSDWNGKENTKIIIDYCKANGKSCPAAEYAYNYKTPGTKAGDWYLPSYGELEYLTMVAGVMDYALRTVGGTQFFGNPDWTFYYSSTEVYRDPYAIWIVEFQDENYEFGKTFKTGENIVRPFIKY